MNTAATRKHTCPHIAPLVPPNEFMPFSSSTVSHPTSPGQGSMESCNNTEEEEVKGCKGTRSTFDHILLTCIWGSSSSESRALGILKVAGWAPPS